MSSLSSLVVVLSLSLVSALSDLFPVSSPVVPFIETTTSVHILRPSNSTERKYRCIPLGSLDPSLPILSDISETLYPSYLPILRFGITGT